MNTVEKLRKQGYKVKVQHERFYLDEWNDVFDLLPRHKVDKDLHDIQQPSPHGGRTVVDITLPDGKNVQGISECSISDNYNRKVGLRIALGRALCSHQT